jgi:FkbM family methyltransferase
MWGVGGKVARNTKAYLDEASKLGAGAAAVLALDRRLMRWGRRRGLRKVTKLRLKVYPHSLYFRHFTSDSDVIKQVFADEEYAIPIENKTPRLIIDCGANIGCTSAYFLAKYPGAHVIAIEPDADNFAVCRKNLEPFGGRATLVQAAVWPCDVNLRIEHGACRDGLEWGHRVRLCREGESADVRGISLPRLLAAAPPHRVDILKIDIEGAEAALFSGACDCWISRVDNIFIELHDADCSAVFFRALSGSNYEIGTSRELTVCRNLRQNSAQT